MSGTVAILEYVGGSAPLRVDRDKGVIYGVKLLGEASANPPPKNHVYPRSTREKAMRVMEGSRCYVNHPDPGKEKHARRYEEAIGVHRNVQERGDGLYGDFHFNPKHHLAEQICWDAEHAPNNLGFSINGHGSPVNRAGKVVIEEITSLNSVDLVSRPATTRGLAEGMDATMPQTLKQLLETLKDRPEAATLREMADAAGMADDATVDAPASASPEDAIKGGFKAAVHAVIDDDKMDMKAKLSRIKDILKAQEKLMGGGEKKDAPSDKGDKKDDGPLAKESKAPADANLTEEVARLRARDLLRTAADEAGVRLPRALLEAVRPTITADEAKALVAELKAAAPAAATGTRPKSGGKALTEGQGNGQAVLPKLEKPADKVAFLRGRR